jgi:hypothetical protein
LFFHLKLSKIHKYDKITKQNKALVNKLTLSTLSLISTLIEGSLFTVNLVSYQNTRNKGGGGHQMRKQVREGREKEGKREKEEAITSNTPYYNRITISIDQKHFFVVFDVKNVIIVDRSN